MPRQERGLESELVRQFGVCRFRQRGPIGEKDGRDASKAVVHVKYVDLAALLLIDIYELIGKLMFVQETPGAPDVRSPGCAVKGDAHLVSHVSLLGVSLIVAICALSELALARSG